jgi:hypothetical protein
MSQHCRSFQILLDEAGTEVNVELYKWRIPNRLEAVDLASFDDKDVSSATLESVAVNRPHSPAFADELDLVIRTPVRPRPEPGLPWNRNTETLFLPFVIGVMATTDGRPTTDS